MQIGRSNSKLSLAKTALVTVSVAGAFAISGCGNDDQADLNNGKQLFTEKCGACHTMAGANSKGVVGPNLDDAFARARKDGMNDATIESVTIGQIKHPSQRVPAKVKMPANIVTGTDARDVAAYVGATAGLEAGASGASGATK